MVGMILQSGAIVGLVVLVLRERRRATGRYPGRGFWLACFVGVGAASAGTVSDVSGVLLAVPVISVAGLAIVRGGWPIGDAGVVLVVLGAGMAAAYLLAAVLDPDTGSFADQGAQALVALGGLVCALTLVWSFLRRRRRRSRAAP